MLGDLPAIVQQLLITLPAFLLAIILHEVAHAWVAYQLGDDTAKLSGRITLSPLPHLDPLGTLMFVLSTWAGFGFGWAKPVPVNPLRFRHPRRDDLLVSLAGVMANLGQAAVWAGLAHLAMRYADPSGTSIAQAAANFFGLACYVNLVLLVFNLIPIPPLDGSHVLLDALNVRDPIIWIRLSQIGPMVLLGLMWFGALNPLFRFTVLPLMIRLLPLDVIRGVFELLARR